MKKVNFGFHTQFKCMKYGKFGRLSPGHLINDKPKFFLHFYYTSCPSVSVGSPCYLEEDLMAEIPNCCPRIECPHPASIEDMPNNEINEIEDDQIMMGGEVMVSYDASLDQVR